MSLKLWFEDLGEFGRLTLSWVGWSQNSQSPLKFLSFADPSSKSLAVASQEQRGVLEKNWMDQHVNAWNQVGFLGSYIPLIIDGPTDTVDTSEVLQLRSELVGGPRIFAGPQQERIVFQPSFFRGELLNFEVVLQAGEKQARHMEDFFEVHC